MYVLGGVRGNQLFSGRGVQNGFPKCGTCELINASERGSCELKISIFGGLRVKIWAKRLKFPIFFSKGGLAMWTDYCLKWDPCELWVTQMGPLWATGEARKGVFHFSRSVPPCMCCIAFLSRVCIIRLLFCLIGYDIFKKWPQFVSWELKLSFKTPCSLFFKQLGLWSLWWYLQSNNKKFGLIKHAHCTYDASLDF